MGTFRNLMLRGRRHDIGVCEDPKTEATLRAALVESVAPGEDESYRRLMTVIADDLRLRQPVRQRNWAWIPTTSVALAGMILAVIAYDAGVQHGTDATAKLFAQRAPTLSGTKPLGNVPWNVYVPPKNGPASLPAPRVDVKEVPSDGAAGSRNVILAWLPLEGLTRDQREFVIIAGKKADDGDWDGAARSLVQMAEQDPASDAAINALHAAAEIQTKRVNNDAAALQLYQRELKACDDQLAATEDPVRQAQLTEWRDRAELGVRLLTTASESEPAAPAPR